MAIELITGTPGAGKTTYAVSKRIAAEVEREFVHEDGTKHRRRVISSGVRGLLLDHEKLPHKLTGEVTSPVHVAKWNAMTQDVDPATGKPLESENPVYRRLAGEPPLDVPAILENWWLWCRPGDLIVVDECQFQMPRGTMGRKAPYWIQCLEIHRHYGVDFLLITQHPNLIDTVVRALVGLHRHVRSVMGSSICTVYTWDHASNPERYQLATKAVWKRGPADYRLFHSSVAHLKPPTSGRSVLVVLPLLIVAGIVGFYHFKATTFGEKKPAGAAIAQGLPMASATAATLAPRPSRALPVGFVDVPKLQGCYTRPDGRCTCVGQDLRLVKVEDAMCRVSAASFDGLVQWERRKEQPRRDPAAASPSASSPVS